MLQRDSSRKLNGSARGGDFGQFLPLFLFLLPHAGGFRTGTARAVLIFLRRKGPPIHLGQETVWLWLPLA